MLTCFSSGQLLSFIATNSSKMCHVVLHLTGQQSALVAEKVLAFQSVIAPGKTATGNDKPAGCRTGRELFKRLSALLTVTTWVPLCECHHQFRHKWMVVQVCNLCVLWFTVQNATTYGEHSVQQTYLKTKTCNYLKRHSFPNWYNFCTESAEVIWDVYCTWVSCLMWREIVS